MRPAIIGLALATFLTTAGQAQQAPTVVELFTSQGCSSCPPADAFLTDLAHQRHDVLPLAFHVTYWDYLGWKDPYSLAAATARQREYARHLGDDGVYTPQMVVDGTTGFVGSDRALGLKAIAAAAAKSVPVSVTRDGQIPAGQGRAPGPARRASCWWASTRRTKPLWAAARTADAPCWNRTSSAR